MILEKLTTIKLEVKFNIYRQKKRLAAVESIQELLNQINLDVEIMPSKDIEKLTKLLISLKGETLNEEESELLKRLVK